MIKLEELNPHNYPETEEISTNLNILLERINKIRMVWGYPMTVTSGLRSQADQTRINPSAPKSKHLIGAAVDIADASGSLKAWLKSNLDLLDSANLWCESFDSTPTWVHFQCIAPASGHRVFIP